MTAAQLAGALVAKGTVSVALTKPHDPDAFYRTRTGLYVYDRFRSRIVPTATPTESASPVTLRSFLIDRKGGATDEEIEAELGANHEFTQTDVCWIIAEMIAKQPKGGAGDLDNSGNANLLYTPSCVVNVCWSAVGRVWSVLTWDRGDCRWSQGDSAFSRN